MLQPAAQIKSLEKKKKKKKKKLKQWVSSNLSWFASLNNKAFGNLFCNPEKSFHTSPRSSDSNNRGYRPFFKLNNGICIYKKS